MKDTAMRQGGRGNNWVGWVIFVLLVFGGRLLPPVANWLSQVTGLPISVPGLIVALLALSVVGSLFGSVARQVGKARSAGETRLPTPMTITSPADSLPRPSSPPRPAAPPQTMRPPSTPVSPGLPSSPNLPPPRLPSGEQRLPGPPKFEPIIDPRVLIFGILGLLVFGAFFLVVFALSGALP